MSIKKFPSINQFRHAIRKERDVAKFEDREPSKRLYRGTIKLHGSNGGVTQQHSGGELQFQSRNRLLKPGEDNLNFAGTWSQDAHAAALMDAMDQIRNNNGLSPEDPVSLFGEWCGEGIQKNVAISKLPKMFVTFAARGPDGWLDPSHIKAPNVPLYSIRGFKSWEKEIDFDQPGLVQNELVAITEEVEAECPFAAEFGVSGIGEGVVWMPVSGDISSDYWFKVKGEKHSTSKVAKLAAIDVEKVKKKDDLVKSLVTDARLEQMLHEHVNEHGLTVDYKDIGPFLRSVFADIHKEESDTIEANGFAAKELGKPISDIAKRFFVKKMDDWAN